MHPEANVSSAKHLDIAGMPGCMQGTNKISTELFGVEGVSVSSASVGTLQSVLMEYVCSSRLSVPTSDYRELRRG